MAEQIPRIQFLRTRRAILDDKLRTADLGKHDDQFERLQRERTNVVEQLGKLEERAAQIEAIRTDPTMREVPGMPSNDLVDYNRSLLTNDRLDEHQNLALRSLDAYSDAFSTRALDRVEHIVRDDSFAAREIAAHSDPAYASAFHKVVTLGEMQASVMMSDLERGALHESFTARHARAQAESSGPVGQYAIPVQIDPSLILVDQESPNPIRMLARTVETNTSAWKGVSSVGAKWSFDAEGSEVSDDGLYSIQQPSVTVFTARGFIPATIEIMQDWPGFSAEMARILSAGYDELLAEKFAAGSGVGEPRGILTALAASSPTSVVTSSTDGAFSSTDIYNVWQSLPAKYQQRASWVMDVTVADQIRQFGTYSNSHAFTVNLPAGAIDSLLGRPVYADPYMPSFNTTTGVSARLCVGAWDNYVIANRSGLAIELVPHLVSTTNARPTGSRGWFSFARIGANTSNDAGFRMLSNE
jgi:HK97 family phage major capsid protein